MTKLIKLTQGQFAIVDDKNFEWLNQWKWFAQKNKKTFYACRNLPTTRDGKRPKVWMHRLILNISDNNIIGDHRDRNGLNNIESNLRVADDLQSTTNRGKFKNSSSIYIGVSCDKDKYGWIAQIQKNKKKMYLGYFKNEIDAAKAYNDAAIRMFGEFANLNKID
jgi:hypothetical protein